MIDDWLSVWSIGFMTDLSIDWLIDLWMDGWIYWLIGCLVYLHTHSLLLEKSISNYTLY